MIWKRELKRLTAQERRQGQRQNEVPATSGISRSVWTNGNSPFFDFCQYNSLAGKRTHSKGMTADNFTRDYLQGWGQGQWNQHRGMTYPWATDCEKTQPTKPVGQRKGAVAGPWCREGACMKGTQPLLTCCFTERTQDPDGLLYPPLSSLASPAA